MANLLSAVHLAALVFVAHFTIQFSDAGSLSMNQRNYLDAPCDEPSKLQSWTRWYDRDDPSVTGDWEDLTNLRNEYPGQICTYPKDIEAVTLAGLTPAQTEEEIYRMDTTFGFVCRNADQSSGSCSDYKVRFSCPPSTCDRTVCWTRWYNRDSPTATGDWEDLGNLKSQYPGQICDEPLYIQAVTVDDNTPAVGTYETFYMYSPTKGFVCRNADQSFGGCRDYKVRFGCQC